MPALSLHKKSTHEPQTFMSVIALLNPLFGPPSDLADVLCWTILESTRTPRHVCSALQTNQRRYDWISTSSLGMSTATAGAARGSATADPGFPTSTRKLLPRFLNLHAKQTSTLR